jgi:hypothetical protein
VFDPSKTLQAYSIFTNKVRAFPIKAPFIFSTRWLLSYYQMLA